MQAMAKKFGNKQLKVQIRPLLLLTEMFTFAEGQKVTQM